LGVQEREREQEEQGCRESFTFLEFIIIILVTRNIPLLQEKLIIMLKQADKFISKGGKRERQVHRWRDKKRAQMRGSG
jgi:hypothetical protein